MAKKKIDWEMLCVNCVSRGLDFGEEDADQGVFVCCDINHPDYKENKKYPTAARGTCPIWATLDNHNG